jgi:hypothetical protein
MGSGIFKIDGDKKGIFIDPRNNHCTLCGVKKHDRWCKHLISAGMKSTPPVHVAQKHDGTKSITQLIKYQDGRKTRTGRKRPKANYYKDQRGPWKYRNLNSEEALGEDTVVTVAEDVMDDVEEDIAEDIALDVIEEVVDLPTPPHVMALGSRRRISSQGAAPVTGSPPPGPLLTDLLPVGKAKCDECSRVVSKKSIARHIRSCNLKRKAEQPPVIKFVKRKI